MYPYITRLLSCTNFLFVSFFNPTFLTLKKLKKAYEITLLSVCLSSLHFLGFRGLWDHLVFFFFPTPSSSYYIKVLSMYFVDNRA
jgi:hypothetical protein